MLLSSIPANYSVQEVLRQIDNDPNATEREKFLFQYCEEFVDTAEAKEEEIASLDDKIDELEGSERKLELEIDVANAEIVLLKGRIAELEKQLVSQEQKVAHAG